MPASLPEEPHHALGRNGLHPWLACIFGFCGIHRFYAGKVGTGLLWLFTVGLLGIGQFVDLFLIPSMIDSANARRVSGGTPSLSE